MKKFSKKTLIICGAALLAVIAVALIFILGACGKDTPPSSLTSSELASFVFSENVTVGQTDVSTMSYEEAVKAVEAAAQEQIRDFTLTVIADDDSFEYKKSDFTWSINSEEAVKKAAELCQSSDYNAKDGCLVELDIKPNEASVNEIVNSIAAEVDVAAVDSTFAVEGEKVNISREKAGRSLNKDDLAEKIYKAVETVVSSGEASVTVEAIVEDVEPKYNLESLSGEIKLISTYTTYSTNTANGNHNMKLALEACDGSVINPGEIWSFNECTGDSNQTSLGYLPATVIANGQFEQGIGGGLCQSSTTIYNAALLANMTVEERYCHQFQSSYVPAGRDATIDYPNLDLKLSNPTDYPMYMQCYMEGNELTVNIFGWDDPAFDYIEIESYVYGATSTDYRASAERVYYLDGKEVKREELPGSRYDYPDSGNEEETTKATKPKATKPKETTPKATTPKTTVPKVTQAPETIPQPTTAAPIVTEPQEVTTAPDNRQETSQNPEQVATATAQY